VDHKEEVLAVLLERYAATAGTLAEGPAGRSHPNLGVLGLTRQGSMAALSKASLAGPEAKATTARQTAGDVKRLGSSRGRLDVKVFMMMVTVFCAQLQSQWQLAWQWACP